MTNSWNDIKNTDLVLVMGGNAAEAHPCGFKWAVEAMQKRKARLVVVDPRFTRSAAIADLYAPLRVGTDIAFLAGVINYLYTHDKINLEYAKFNTDITFLLKPDFKFEGGLFSGYNEAARSYDRASWGYQLGEDGFVRVDETLQDPLCVFQQMKRHYARYTPEMVSRITGTPQAQFLRVCEAIAATSARDKAMTILYALGWTQHSVGSQNIRTMTMIQLLLGNIGVAGGGINALRGHANVQGVNDQNAYSEVISGYMSSPTDADTTRAAYLRRITGRPLRPHQMAFTQNVPRWNTSVMKAWYGDAATADNDYAYDWFPKRDADYDIMAVFERMHQGQMNGYIVQGFNPLAAMCNKTKMSEAFAKLKFLVVMEPLDTETSEFWRNFGPLNNVDPKTIQTEVIRLPASCFAEDSGTFTSSGRMLQWKEAAVPPPGEAKVDREIIGRLFMKLRALYAREGGTLPEPIAALTWPYANPNSPGTGELLREINGRALRDVLAPPDPANPAAPRAVLVRAGEQLPAFGLLQDDGSTACGNWIYCGVWGPAGNLSARRDTADPSGLGIFPGWAWTWPVNRRVLYNRASADRQGRPWDPSRTLLSWSGTRWVGPDVPDIRPDAQPELVGSFIMVPEGVGRLHAVGMVDGPFPEHYEPFESPVATNLMHPENPKAKANPAARVYKGDLEAFGTHTEFPYAATTYRVTEHHHFWTKHAKMAAVVQPAPFVEISEDLAREKGIRAGDRVRVWSNRGEVFATAVVTKRLRTLQIDGRPVHTVGIPIHWGFKGVTQNGFLANALTPYVGDANVQTPEYKAFIVNLAKA